MNFDDIKLFARLSGMTAEHITEIFEAGAIDIDEADQLIGDLNDAVELRPEPEDQELSTAAERLVHSFGDLFIEEDAA